MCISVTLLDSEKLVMRPFFLQKACDNYFFLWVVSSVQSVFFTVESILMYVKKCFLRLLHGIFNRSGVWFCVLMVFANHFWTSSKMSGEELRMRSKVKSVGTFIMSLIVKVHENTTGFEFAPASTQPTKYCSVGGSKTGSSLSAPASPMTSKASFVDVGKSLYKIGLDRSMSNLINKKASFWSKDRLQSSFCFENRIHIISVWLSFDKHKYLSTNVRLYNMRGSPVLLSIFYVICTW